MVISSTFCWCWQNKRFGKNRFTGSNAEITPGISVSPKSSSSSQLISLSLSTLTSTMLHFFNVKTQNHEAHQNCYFSDLCLLSPTLQCLPLNLLLVYQVNLDISISHWSFGGLSNVPWRSTSPKIVCGAQLREPGYCSASSRGHCWSSARRSRPVWSRAPP